MIKTIEWFRFADKIADEDIYDYKKKLLFKKGDVIEKGSLPKVKDSIWVSNEDDLKSDRIGRGAMYKVDKRILDHQSTHPDVVMVGKCTEYSYRESSKMRICLVCQTSCPNVKTITHWRKAFDE